MLDQLLVVDLPLAQRSHLHLVWFAFDQALELFLSLFLPLGLSLILVLSLGLSRLYLSLVRLE